jgi:nitrate reductase gamma subunit
MNLPAYLDRVLFVGLPYTAISVCVLVSLQRYGWRMFTYSSLSSQFLENRTHFWALVPFHYGILTVLLGHVIGFSVPRAVLAWNGRPLRLYVLEVVALVFGVLTLISMLLLINRRLVKAKVRAVTSVMDWIMFAVLLFQVASGVYVAVFTPWGSTWYAAVAVPYLWSIFGLNPSTATVSQLPLAAQLHIINAFILIGLFPFTRLVHMLVVPNPYLWRRPQVVRWYGSRSGAQS